MPPVEPSLSLRRRSYRRRSLPHLVPAPEEEPPRPGLAAVPRPRGHPRRRRRRPSSPAHRRRRRADAVPLSLDAGRGDLGLPTVEGKPPTSHLLPDSVQVVVRINRVNFLVDFLTIFD